MRRKAKARRTSDRREMLHDLYELGVDPHRLRKLKAALRAGFEPPYDTVLLGVGRVKFLGEGAFRSAYRVGPFVVKRKDHENGRSSVSRRQMARVNVRKAPTLNVGHWQIQLRYKPLDMRTRRARRISNDQTLLDGGGNKYDLHFDNLGRDHKGRVVAFDWCCG